MDNKLKILNYLAKHREPITMHELSKSAKIPYATLHRTILQMPQIKFQRIGHAKTVQINENTPSLSSYISVSSEEERREFLKQNPVMASIAEGLTDTTLLFGSYAKSTQKESSDIDLLIINNQGKKTSSFSKYETLFKKKINPIFITWNELKAMLKEQEENVGKQALRHHIILKNPEKFWEAALDA